MLPLFKTFDERIFWDIQWCLTKVLGHFASSQGKQGYSLEVRREHDGGPEQRSLFDLPAETENSILLEALADV